MSRLANWRAPLAATLATFALHAGLFLGLGAPGSFKKYLLAAEQDLAGTLPAERLMDFSPLYLALCRVAVRMFADPEPLLLWLQVAMVAVTAGLLVVLLRRRFHELLVMGAALVFLLHRPLLVYELVLEPEVVQLFLLVSFLALVGAAFRGRLLLAGVVAALSLANRPSLLPLFLLVPVYLWMRRRAPGEHPCPRWRQTLWFGVPVLAMVVLLGARAWQITGDPRTPVMNPGTVFFEGNHPLSHGISATYPPVVLNLTKYAGETPDAAHEFYRQVARAGRADAVDVRGVNSFWAGRAMAYLTDHPGVALRLWVTKLYHVFHEFEWHDIRNAWSHDRRLPVFSVGWSCLSVLALAGMFLERRRFREGLLLYGVFALQVAVMVVFYVSARQRLVLLVPFLYFALATVEWIGRQRRGGLWLLLGGVVLALPLVVRTDAMRDHTDLRERHRRHDQLKQQVEHEDLDLQDPAAVRAGAARLVESLAEVPWLIEWSRPPYFPQGRRVIDLRVVDLLDAVEDPSPSLRFDRAVLRHSFVDEIPAAVKELEGLAADGTGFLRGSHRSSSPEYFLARAAVVQDDPAAAVAHLHRALERTPADPFVLADLVALGEPHHRESLERYYGPMDAAWLLGEAFLVHRQPRQAVTEFQTLVTALPRFRDGHMFLAAALAADGRSRDAASHYQQGVALRESPVRVYWLGAVFQDLFMHSAGQPQIQRFCAEAMLHCGDFGMALTILQSLDVPADQRAELDRRIQWVRATLAANS